MSILKKRFAGRVASAGVVVALVTVALGATAQAALADQIVLGKGNSPAAAAESGQLNCYRLTPYQGTEILRIWSVVDSNGATVYRAQVRCY